VVIVVVARAGSSIVLQSSPPLSFLLFLLQLLARPRRYNEREATRRYICDAYVTRGFVAARSNGVQQLLDVTL
jgi:CDP-diacylglycerol pyrophosphatase